jgi:hypothetical protein
MEKNERGSQPHCMRTINLTCAPALPHRPFSRSWAASAQDQAWWAHILHTFYSFDTHSHHTPLSDYHTPLSDYRVAGVWRHKHIHMINSAERARQENSDPCEPSPSRGPRASCTWGGARGRSENSSGVNAAAERSIKNRELLPVFATASPLLRQPPLAGESAVSHRTARSSITRE